MARRWYLEAHLITLNELTCIMDMYNFAAVDYTSSSPV